MTQLNCVIGSLGFSLLVINKRKSGPGVEMVSWISASYMQVRGRFPV